MISAKANIRSICKCAGQRTLSNGKHTPSGWLDDSSRLALRRGSGMDDLLRHAETSHVRRLNPGAHIATQRGQSAALATSGGETKASRFGDSCARIVRNCANAADDSITHRLRLTAFGQRHSRPDETGKRRDNKLLLATKTVLCQAPAQPPTNEWKTAKQRAVPKCSHLAEFIKNERPIQQLCMYYCTYSRSLGSAGVEHHCAA